MTSTISTAVLLAMAAPSDQSLGVWAILPWALILAIFYFIIMRPMQAQRKKVEAFQNELKAGDKVVTSGGLFGTITKTGEKTVQLQIAPNVRVEITRAAIVGYQGQAPVADAAAS